MLKELLSKEIGFIREHESSFLDCFVDFGYETVTDLIEVHFSDTEVKFVYLLENGQHVADGVKLKDYYNWKQNYTDWE